jgi:signal transduction histidine kinase
MARLDRPALVVAVAVAVTAAIAAVAIFAIPGQRPPTYRAASNAAHIVGIGAGAALIMAAVAAFAVARRPAGALLLIGAAALWFAEDLQALGDSAALARSIATIVGPFAAAVTLQLALVLPDRPLSPAGRRGVVTAYLAAAASGIAVVTLRDPFSDVDCWRQCGSNPLLVHSAPHVAHAFVVAGLVLSIVVGAAAVAVVAQRIAGASRTGRVLIGPVLLPVALLAAAEAAHGVALLVSPLEDPHRPGFMAVYIARAVALGLVAAGVGWTVVRAYRTRVRVTRLAAALGTAPVPGSFHEALAAAVGDPKVEVLYWVPALGRFAGADGALRPAPTRAATRITRGGRLLALVVHESAALSGAELERLLGSSARLAIENEALRAEVLAQLEQLRRSRARIVATADDTRRRLERDLHDGAQQRLLSVVLDLRLARAGAEGALAEQVAGVGAEVDRGFNELRELAHGIYPAVLTEAGLEAALPSLASLAPIAVKMGDVTAQRLPSPVEAGAYVTADEAIRDAAARHATAISVSATLEGGQLVVTAHDNGAPRDSTLVHVADRVGALGGELELSPTSLRAKMPCA